MPLPTLPRPCAVCVGLAISLLPVASTAAEGKDSLNAQKIDRPETLPAKPDEPFQLPPLPPLSASAPDELSALKVERIVFRGNTVVPTADLERLAAPYSGRLVSVAELENLRQRLTRHYVDLGYVNSGVLLAKKAPASDGDSSASIIVFSVLEGRLSTLRLQGMEGLDDLYVTRRLVKETDGPLNMDVLRERYQLLLSDPLFARLNARLMPDVRLGEAILDIDVARAKPYQLTLFANNARPPSIGSAAAGLSGWLRNLTGQGDFLEASVQAPPNSLADARLSLAWRMPLGQRGTQLSAEIDQGRSSVIEEPMQVLNIRSMLDTRDLGISQTLLETLGHKLAIGLNHIQRENRTTLLGSPFSFNPGEPDGVSKEVLWRFWQEYTIRSETQVLALRSTFSSGKNNVRATANLPENSTVIVPQAHYKIWLGQAQYARQVLENGAQAMLRGSIQRTSEKLLPLDGLSVGGVNTVRGYRENQLIRDNGETFSFEFDYPLFEKSAKGLNLSLIPFYDYGRGRNRNEPATALSSWGLASRARWQGVSLDIAVAQRLSHPATLQRSTASLQDRGIHFNLSYSY